MHPALRPENLSSLSPNLQRVASSIGIDRFMGLSNNLGESQYQAMSFLASPATVLPLLPVWYQNLDPLGLPSPDDISTAQALGRTIVTVAVALLSLQAIPALRNTPSGVYPELWARVWSWIEFLHIHREHLVALPTRTNLHQIFMKIFVHFQVFGCRELVAATPGVCAVVGSAWDSSLETGDEDAISNVSFFINREASDSDFGPIDEYLDEVGGGGEYLAAMLIKHLSHAITDGVTPMSRPRRSHFAAVLYFIVRANKSDNLLQRLSDALISRGIISALITSILCLTPVVGDQGTVPEMLGVALYHLGRYSTASPGLSNMCNALQAGLLRALVLAASVEPHTEQIHDQLSIFFQTTLPSYTVYRSILVQLPSFLSEVEELVDVGAFKESAQWAAWQAFRIVVQDRLMFVQEFDSRTNVRYKACDNMECQHIRVKSDLRRCSTCLDLYYCSKECQTADWRAGHRDDCRTFSGLRRLPEEEQCNMKDRAFLRALIRRDYLLHRRQIYTERILAWVRNPTQLSYVLFDYMHGAPSVAVRPWPRDHSEMLEHPLDWERRHYNYGCRAAKSHLLEVHLMAIPNGSKTHWKFMPMRYTGTEILDKLWAIVDKVTEKSGAAHPNLEASITDEVEPLLVMDPQIIHE
ncbi:hypothetical protein C8R47DRAFT_129873 [Mycena vitilis]|nr:hypothetical protein C8R47DRAFT_129873 [Mycena vitilis]